jgi:hypothetical protein
LPRIREGDVGLKPLLVCHPQIPQAWHSKNKNCQCLVLEQEVLGQLSNTFVEHISTQTEKHCAKNSTNDMARLVLANPPGDPKNIEDMECQYLCCFLGC